MKQNLPEDQHAKQAGPLEDAITKALERHPRVDLSAGFAARVMSNLPTKKAVRETKHVAHHLLCGQLHFTFADVVLPISYGPK